MQEKHSVNHYPLEEVSIFCIMVSNTLRNQEKLGRSSTAVQNMVEYHLINS